MFRVRQMRIASWARASGPWLASLIAAVVLSACSSGSNLGDLFPGGSSGGPPPGAQQQPTAIGSGQVKVGLILPLSAGGNAGVAAISMRNASEMAIAEFNSPNIQLLVKDDAGTAQGAQTAAQQALEEGAEIILGPLFAHTVGVVGQTARARNVPVIAFSTDANVASRGVYLLSFLVESDVDRIIQYSTTSGKRSFAALIPDNAYGSVAEAAFNQAIARRGARVVTLQRYPADRAQQGNALRAVAQVARNADALFIPDNPEGLRTIAPQLAASGIDVKRLQLVGTGQWDDPQVSAEPSLQGGLFPAPDSAGFRNFSNRYRTKYGQEPVRTATLAYDAVALIAALVKTQGPQRFSEETLTNASGFTGIDGLFRFRPDGTNQRGLSVKRVTSTGDQTVSPAPKSFGSGT